MIFNPKCTRCSLHKECSHVCLPGSGAIEASIMLVAEAPGREEDGEGQGFVGKSGELLAHCLEYLSIPWEAVYKTYAIKCKPIGALPGKKTDREEIIRSCRPYLDSEIRNRPLLKCIVALGGTALQVLTEGKHSAIANWNGRIAGSYKNLWVYGAYSPGFVLKSPSKERELTAAIALAARAAGIKTTWSNPTPFNYEY